MCIPTNVRDLSAEDRARGPGPVFAFILDPMDMTFSDIDEGMTTGVIKKSTFAHQKFSHVTVYVTILWYNMVVE